MAPTHLLAVRTGKVVRCCLQMVLQGFWGGVFIYTLDTSESERREHASKDWSGWAYHTVDQGLATFKKGRLKQCGLAPRWDSACNWPLPLPSSCFCMPPNVTLGQRFPNVVGTLMSPYCNCCHCSLPSPSDMGASGNGQHWIN